LHHARAYAVGHHIFDKGFLGGLCVDKKGKKVELGS